MSKMPLVIPFWKWLCTLPRDKLEEIRQKRHCAHRTALYLYCVEKGYNYLSYVRHANMKYVARTWRSFILSSRKTLDNYIKKLNK